MKAEILSPLYLLILCFLLALAFPDLCRWVGYVPK